MQDTVKATDQKLITDVAEQEANPINPDVAIVELDEPVKRGQTAISTITIHRPRSGALRGVNLIDLANLNTTALMTVLPRITQPSLTKEEVSGLDPADLTALGVEVAGFLAQKKVKAEFQ